MFFSILVSDLHVVVHSQWEGIGLKTQCKLRILTTKEAARQLLSQLPAEEAVELTKHLPGLRETAQDSSVDLEGLTAASLSSFIGTCHENVISYRQLPARQELLGFWEPSDGAVPGEGIIMWSDLDVNYHVAIVYSKDQAEDLIRSFNWLQPERCARLLDKITRWNALDSSQQAERLIDGIPAKLLCRASITMKVMP